MTDALSGIGMKRTPLPGVGQRTAPFRADPAIDRLLGRAEPGVHIFLILASQIITISLYRQHLPLLGAWF